MNEAVPREDLPGFEKMRPIIGAVTKAYQMTEAAMIAPGKSPTPAQARAVCAWLAVKLEVRLSYSEIGEVLGARTKGSTVHSLSSVERLRGEDAWVKDTTDRLLAELSA